MKLLLDTHVLLWWMDDHPRLSLTARDYIADRHQKVYVSAATIWEAAIKEAKGLLKLSNEFDTKLAAEPFLPLPITHQHARKSGALPPIHKDPFDRLLVGQCLHEGMTLVTKDDLLSRYGISVLAA